MDVNQILITEYAFCLLNTSMYSQCTICKKKISVSHLSTYQFRSICWYKSFRRIPIAGQMGYSKNRRTFVLYSGIIGAFLQNNDLSTDNSWYHPSLHYACDWLQQNNPYLSAYHSIASHLSAHNSQTSPTVWPQATQVSDSNSEFVSPAHLADIIVPSYDFPDEIHNEDSHYSRLVIDFFMEKMSIKYVYRFGSMILN